MKDEIKLWKEKTKGLFNIVEWTRFWNYITNLQKENNKLRSMLIESIKTTNKAIEIIDKELQGDDK